MDTRPAEPKDFTVRCYICDSFEYGSDMFAVDRYEEGIGLKCKICATGTQEEKNIHWKKQAIKANLKTIEVIIKEANIKDLENIATDLRAIIKTFKKEEHHE